MLAVEDESWFIWDAKVKRKKPPREEIAHSLNRVSPSGDG